MFFQSTGGDYQVFPAREGNFIDQSYVQGNKDKQLIESGAIENSLVAQGSVSFTDLLLGPLFGPINRFRRRRQGEPEQPDDLSPDNPVISIGGEITGALVIGVFALGAFFLIKRNK